MSFAVDSVREWQRDNLSRGQNGKGLGSRKSSYPVSLGKSQVLLLVQPRVFATANHFQEMLWSPTSRALGEVGLEDSGAGEAELVFFIYFHALTLLISASTHQRRCKFVSVVPSPSNFISLARQPRAPGNSRSQRTNRRFPEAISISKIEINIAESNFPTLVSPKKLLSRKVLSAF